MRVYDVIYKKRNGGKLSPEEIRFMVDGFTAGDIPDYQMAAFLMSVWYSKMDGEERAVFTKCMLDSGDKMEFNEIPGIKVDKHSTGGVGDGVSLSLAPIVATAGGVIPMMSGRGLGHTGGTLDKLEAIPGYTVVLTEDEIRKNLEKIGLVIMGQTEAIAPADRKMYSLRDVTATVDSIDLISGSIMSKKLAEGMDALILDVKTGKGAFMQTLEDSKNLALSMSEIGVNLGKNVMALITDMNQPLGRAVGNALEIKQAIDILKNKGPADIVEVVTQLAIQMLMMAKISNTPEEARAKVKEIIESGAAVEKMKEMVVGHKGDPRAIDDPSMLPTAKKQIEIKSPKSGYIQDINALEVGISAQMLGAGRETMDSELDLAVGMWLLKKVGDKVEEGEPLPLCRRLS